MEDAAEAVAAVPDLAVEEVGAVVLALAEGAALASAEVVEEDVLEEGASRGADSDRAAGPVAAFPGRTPVDRSRRSVAPRRGHRFRRAEIVPVFRLAVAIVRTSLPEM